MSDPAQLLVDHLDIWTGAIQRKNGAGRGNGGKLSLYGIEKLRSLILDLAVRGKLVPQNLADESASELVKKLDRQCTESSIGKFVSRHAEKGSLNVEEKPYEIPQGWEWVNVAKLGHNWGQCEPKAEFTYIDVGSIDQRAGKIVKPTVLEASAAPSRARKIVKAGTVIYSTVRPYLLNIAIVDEDFDQEPIASTAFAIIHPFEGVEARYVYLTLRSPFFVKYVEDCQTGIAYPAVNDKQFFRAPFPLPPLAEQRRIVTKVDELMALANVLEAGTRAGLAAHETLVRELLGTLINSQDADDLTDNWSRIETHFDTLFTTQESIDTLKQTILEMAVRGKLAPSKSDSQTIGRQGFPSDWKIEELKSLTGEFDSGWSPACPDRSVDDADEWGVLRTTAVQDLAYQEWENKALPANLKPRPNAEVHPGDVIITRAGPYNRVGVVCFVEVTRPRLMLSDKLIRFRPDEHKVDGEYLVLALRSGISRDYLLQAQSGMAKSQVNISQAKLAKTPIPFPKLDQQKLIVRKVREFIYLCEQLKTDQKKAQQILIKLADAIVRCAAG